MPVRCSPSRNDSLAQPTIRVDRARTLGVGKRRGPGLTSRRSPNGRWRVPAQNRSRRDVAHVSYSQPLHTPRNRPGSFRNSTPSCRLKMAPLVSVQSALIPSSDAVCPFV
jgi:hypothetical protein